MAEPSKLTVHFPQGTRTLVIRAEDASEDLAEVLRRAGLALNTRCGRQALCDGCLVDLIEGVLVEVDSGRAITAEVASSPRRACQYLLREGGSAEIRVPARSLLAHEPQVVESFRCNVTHAHEPLWQRLAVASGELTREVPVAEQICQRASDQLAASLPVRAAPDLLSAVDPWPSEILLAAEYRGDHWSLSPAAATGRPDYGVAVDIGTTTVVLLLVDLDTGDVISTSSALNAQTYLGDNVLTRIDLCLNDKGKINELRQAVTEKTLVPLLAEVLAAAQASPEQVVSVSVAGNTTMLHLLAGVDPSSMGSAPFTPQFLEHRAFRCDDLPFEKFRDTSRPTLSVNGRSGPDSTEPNETERTGPALHLLPGAAAYIGADITAGVFSSGMVYRREPSLLVDMGTNGEIVLKYEDHLVGCATAAGPAFEGAGLTCGVRAGNGAISHVRLAGDPLRAEFDVIGGGLPIGLCGTAYVDFVAEARRKGLIDEKGRITSAWLKNDLVRPLTRGRGVFITSGRGGEPLVISEADIAALLQAKAAIAAGIVCLLKRFGLSSHDVDTVYLAGGFGFHMDIDNLIGCGLLPDFCRSQVRVVGNTSLAGAYLSLLDAGAIEEIKRISAGLEIVELNLEPEFTSRYIDQLWLP